MAITKRPGDQYGATISFQYQGAGGDTGVGIGLSPAGGGSPLYWAFTYVSLPSATVWSPFSVNVTDVIPLSASPGLYDAVKNVGIVGQTPLQVWDSLVYEVVVSPPPPTTVSFNLALRNVPYGWDYWLPYWFDGTVWRQVSAYWVPVTDYVSFFSVPSNITVGLYLWDSFNQIQSGFYQASFVAADFGYYVYDFNTGSVSLGTA